MATPITFAYGEHVLCSQPVTHLKPEFADTNPPSVVLTASMRSDQGTPAFPEPYAETTLAVQMDARVAIELYEQLGDLIRNMGWQQHIKGGRPI